MITRRRFIKSLVAGVGALIVAPSLVLPYEPKVIYSIPLQSYENLREEAMLRTLSKWYAKQMDEALFKVLMTGYKPPLTVVINQERRGYQFHLN